MKMKNKIFIWSDNPLNFHGHIIRTPIFPVGKLGVVQYKIFGKLYYSTNNGRDVTLPISVINRLKEKGELK